MSKTKKIALQVSEESIRLQHNEAKKTLSKLIEARRIVRAITRQPVETITGEMELDKALTHDTFPNSPKHRLAELLGCENEYKRYLTLKKDIVGIERFEVKDGQVDIKESWLKKLREDHTYYIDGERAEQWQKLKKLETLWNEVQQDISIPIANLVNIKYDKTMEVNTSSFRYALL